MPTIDNSVLETEVTALLEDSINNDHNNERDWLLAQPSDVEGWNISEWSLDNLIVLYELLHDNPDTKEEKLTRIIAKRVDGLKGKNKTDSAA